MPWLTEAAVQARAAQYHAAAMVFGRIPAGAGRAALVRLHRHLCRRARLGDAAWHLRQAVHLRRLIAAA